MKVFKISQDENRAWDTYDSAVVIAEDEEAARNMHPSGSAAPWTEYLQMTWAKHPSGVSVECVGTTDRTKAQIICSSFNAG